MATSSITKDFYVKDETAYNKLKKDIEGNTVTSIKATESHSLEEGRKLLAAFRFKEA